MTDEHHKNPHKDPFEDKSGGAMLAEVGRLLLVLLGRLLKLLLKYILRALKFILKWICKGLIALIDFIQFFITFKSYEFIFLIKHRTYILYSLFTTNII